MIGTIRTHSPSSGTVSAPFDVASHPEERPADLAQGLVAIPAGGNLTSAPRSRTWWCRDALAVFVEAKGLAHRLTTISLDRVASPGSGGRSGSCGSVRPSALEAPSQWREGAHRVFGGAQSTNQSWWPWRGRRHPRHPCRRRNSARTRMVPLHVCGIQCKGRQAFWGRTCHHGSGRDRPMMSLLIPAGAERVPLASGGTAGRSPEAISWRSLARSSPWFIREEQQEGGHGAPRNPNAWLDRDTISPGRESAGLPTLQVRSSLTRSFGGLRPARQRGDCALRSATRRSDSWLARVQFGA